MLTNYFRDGLDRHELMVYFGARGSEDSIRAYLGDATRSVLDRGDLVVGVAEDVYTPGGRFDCTAQIAACEAMVATALADGYQGLRLFGDVAGVQASVGESISWTEYEFRLDLLASRLPIVALCGYDAAEIDKASFRLVDAVHNHGAGERPSEFHIHGRPGGGVMVQGDLDHEYAGLAEGLLIASAQGADAPVIDVSHLDFVCAAGTAAVFEACRASPGATVLGGSPMFRKIWHLLGYDQHHDIENGASSAGDVAGMVAR